MLRSGSGKILVLFFLATMAFIHCYGQEVINKVELERRQAFAYRINYSFDHIHSGKIRQVVLKIYRRRDGQVTEVFSLPLLHAQRPQQGRTYTYNWKTNAATLKPGDELQARIILDYERPPVVSTNAKANQIPIANAGPFLELQLPLNHAVFLDGSRSEDPDGKIQSVFWKQIAGPESLIIIHPDSMITELKGNMKEGRYAFEFTVKDNKGATNSDRVVINVKPPLFVALPPRPVKPQLQKKDSVRTVASGLPTHSRLRGGPSNALANVLVPGLGHYFVSGNEEGKNRKASSFMITAAYAASIGGAFYFRMKSGQEYSKYKELASFREYQRDSAGNVIGVRGADGTKASNQFQSAKNATRNARILLCAGAAIWAGDLVYTFIKGSKNRESWKKHQGSTGFFLSTGDMGLTAGIRFQF